MNNERWVNSMLKSAAVLVLGAALLAPPSFANNGKGNGGSNGNSGNSNSQTASAQPANDKGKAASGLGKLNGFMHASPNALAHASPKSAIGKVSIVYAGLLGNYLAPPAGTTPPTLAEVAAALAAAANKPLTAGIIAAINQKLLAANPALAADLTASGKDAQTLANDIFAAIGA